MPRVFTASPGIGDLGSFGKASYELVAQFDFPDEYEAHEHLRGWDSDRLFSDDYDHMRKTFTKHLKTGELALGNWARNATQEQLLAFCVDALKGDPKVEWTGCRVMGTVNRSNGFPVWTIEIFAKDPQSSTSVYSGPVAPNVHPYEPELSSDGTYWMKGSSHSMRG